MSELLTTAKGTRPEGVASEAEAARQVRDMFGRIAPRYDLLNHVLSLQLDSVWRWRVARRIQSILDRPGATALDLCCGTGDLGLALARAGKARVVGIDFAHSMLIRAKEKSAAHLRRTRTKGPLAVLEADALRLPFADASFDLAATAFGFRNLANYESGLLEILRILKPGGTLAILEFTAPPEGVFGALYRWYFRSVLPRLGRVISGDKLAYSYLPASVSRFFLPEELAAFMTTMGYRETKYELWTGGTVALHTGNRAK